MQISGSSATHSGSGGTSWTFTWIPPATGSGDVTVNLAILNANRNGGTSGDVWSKTTFTIPELVATDTDGDGVQILVMLSPMTRTNGMIVMVMA